MKTRLVRKLYPAFLAVATLLLLGVAACATEPPVPTREPVPPTSPEVMRSGPSTAAVPVSRDVVLEFAAEQEAVNEDWDKFHVDFDSWRARLSACDRTAAQEALRVFASDFAAITQQARDLPGKGVARELPDNVILAANGEEAALRMLRDQWQPGNPSLLENAQAERGNAANLLRATSIEVDKLEELDKPEYQAIAEDFSDALEPVEEAWDAFNDNYKTLEDDHIDLASEEIVTRLRALAEEHETVLGSLEDIPSDKVTDPVHDLLTEAAETEAEAFEDLLDAFRRIAKAEAEAAKKALEAEESEEGSGEAANGNGADSESEEGAGASGTAPRNAAQDRPADGLSLGENPGDQGPLAQVPGDGASSAVPAVPFTRPVPATGSAGSAGQNGDNGEGAVEVEDYSAHFDKFEDTLDETRVVRKQATRQLAALIEGVSEEDKEALAEFTEAFNALTEDWDEFHLEFDQWVRTEGDCDRSAAVSQLNLLNQRFSVLGSRVRELSQASYLRPSADLLSEAMDREGAALRSLSSTWAPYESDVYRGLDEERANAGNLRRLADRRTLEVMERNGITP